MYCPLLSTIKELQLPRFCIKSVILMRTRSRYTSQKRKTGTGQKSNTHFATEYYIFTLENATFYLENNFLLIDINHRVMFCKYFRKPNYAID